MAKVTILLTSFNHEKFLKRSIDSILNQTFSDFELYIIDDCSTDQSWNVIKSYQDSRITAIRHSVNRGRSDWPEFQSQFTGEYFAVAHCDDMWKPEKLKKQVAYLDNNLDCAACFTEIEVINEDDSPLDDEKSYFASAFHQTNHTRYEWLNSFFYRGCG